MKGRFDKATNKCDTTTDVQKAIDYISKGFFFVENKTALKHNLGGYIKVSKRVTNYFNQ
jgi:hypothetical protein